MVELTRLARSAFVLTLMSGMTNIAWAQTPLEGVKSKRTPPKEGQLAPVSGNLGPVSRSLRRLKGNVPNPTFRLAKPNDLKQTAIKPKSAINTPTQRPQSVADDAGNQERETTRSQCRAALMAVSNAASVSPPQSDDAQCVVPDPVSMKTLNSTPNVGLSASPVLDCEFALTFAKFMRDTAQPLAKFHLKTTIQNVQTGPGFTCRRRNNLATGKLSEHSFGNAIDIAAFKLSDGRKIPIQLGSLHEADAAAFQAALRKAACGHFTTVLGPGSNAAHATHLHFDLGRSKGKKNPYRICE